MTIYGGMERDKREAVRAAFQADPKISTVRILVATDAASEGIDLQNHCHLMIHTEIPWNPNVLEQRIGRIDRHGQKANNVSIWHPVGAGHYRKQFGADVKAGSLEGDLEYLMVAARKIAGEFFKRFGAQFAGDGDTETAQAGDDTAPAEAAQPDAESNDATSAESGADATKRKRSWTAWISKS